MRKSLSKSFVILFISLIILTDCSDSTNNTVENDVIMPLAVGNYWIYSMFLYNTSDKDNKTILDTIYLGFKEERILNDEIWFLTEDEEYLFRNSDYGLLIISKYIDKDFSANYAMPKAKYPTYVGEKFSSMGQQYETIGINVRTTIQVGTFDCVVYYSEYLSDFMYYAPNIGLIKNEGIAKIDILPVPPDTTYLTYELIEYNINN